MMERYFFQDVAARIILKYDERNRVDMCGMNSTGS
jgi:hypothetical protein